MVLLSTLNNIQYWTKLFCRAIQYFSSVCLVLLLIRASCTDQKDTAGVIGSRQQVVNGTSSLCPANKYKSREICLPCPRGHFSFRGWSKCRAWLNCTAISLEVRTEALMGGYTKVIYIADWNGHRVVYSKCSRKEREFRERCMHGMRMMEQLQSDFVTRLIGVCYERLEVSYILGVLF